MQTLGTALGPPPHRLLTLSIPGEGVKGGADSQHKLPSRAFGSLLITPVLALSNNFTTGALMQSGC